MICSKEGNNISSLRWNVKFFRNNYLENSERIIPKEMPFTPPHSKPINQCIKDGEILTFHLH